MDPKKGSAEESWGVIKRVWKKFQIYLKRKLGKDIQFLWVVEEQKNGYAHLHVLINKYIPQAWIKESWDALGGGRIVFITRSDVRNAGLYLAKYLTKGFYEGMKPGQRRYGSSRGISLRPYGGKKEGSWTVVKMPLEDLVRRYRDQEGILTEGRAEDGSLEFVEAEYSVIHIPE